MVCLPSSLAFQIHILGCVSVGIIIINTANNYLSIGENVNLAKVYIYIYIYFVEFNAKVSWTGRSLAANNAFSNGENAIIAKVAFRWFYCQSDPGRVGGGRQSCIFQW